METQEPEFVHVNGAPREAVNNDTHQYRVLDQYHSEPSYMRVVCAGAGAAGLLVAYKLQQSFTNYDLVVYDKNPKVGGTWFENRYPGCACDLPAHAYVFPFEPNPNWSHFYAPAPEILQYFENFASKYDLHKYIRLNSRVVSAVWNDELAIYDIEVESGGQIVKDWAHIFINGTGFLNNLKWPDVPGLLDFKGTLMHSADWDTSLNYDGKRIAVIGTGSSAIQMVPLLQRTAKHLTVFARSATWIYPAISNDVLEEEKARNGIVNEEEQYEYTESDKKNFKDNPDVLLRYRKRIETMINDSHDRFLKGSKLAPGTLKVIESNMRRKLGPQNEALASRLIPNYTPGCRRPTPGDGYLEALTKPNVEIVFDEISRIEPSGIVDRTGKLHEVDIIACATGFHIAFAPRFEVKGRDGADMKTEFEPEPKVYLALTVPKFPNYFVVNGPRGNWAVGNVLASHEIQVDYIMKCLQRIQTEGIRSFEPKADVVDQLAEHADEWHKMGIWTDNCRSWYKNGNADGKVWIWPGAGYHYMFTIGFVRWEHYNYTYKHRNLWSFLGNGYTPAQYKHEKEKLSPYIRKTDTKWQFEG